MPLTDRMAEILDRRMRDLEAERDALKGRVADLEAALKPFADFAPYAEAGEYTFRPASVVPARFPTVSDFAKAAEVVKETP